MDNMLYLGDGVYASISPGREYIYLHIGDHRNSAVVAIEPEVLNMLNLFAEAHGFLKP